ncbi:uracil-DNA glycosylase family protein [Lysobacter sp. K5869]|uniref:uracil-DNA glycosylase family protein n=1 Tax=Lysobacter sp. K5869 TaxID=2820808 RepID=UPI001C060505|nr:uracil-DNA glycosylase family protein [Lysobacter sp. K5869]QWP77383.1 uracil-DNA glycosylase family protein [Lysobacter sp. K5869]
MPSLPPLLHAIRACTLCAAHLPHGVRPVLQASAAARLLIAGQAPGRKVHESGIPFDDASGERLRDWLGVDRETFYDAARVAIVPMGFCYPGKGKSGDLPPRPECAPAWQARLLPQLRGVRMTLAVGQYAQAWHLPGAASLTQAVAAWRERWPRLVALPHPSPRNNLWLKRNPWFERELVPALREQVARALAE